MEISICDETELGFGWIAAEPELLERASHALVADGRVWLVDPVDGVGLEERVAGAGGARRGCSSSSTATPVTARRSRGRLGVPHLRVPFARGSRVALPGPEGPRRPRLAGGRALVGGGGASSSARRRSARRPTSSRRDEQLGVHPALRLYQPRALRDMAKCLAPRHVLVGHGEGIHGDGAAAALARAVGGARRATPALAPSSAAKEANAMREDLVPGNPFPDLRLPEVSGRETALSEIAEDQALVLAFVRGWWCPKEQVRLRNLVGLQDEIQREFGRIAAITVDEPYVNGAFRAGLGGAFPFLSDVGRKVAERARPARADRRDTPALPALHLRARLAPRHHEDLVRILVLGEPDARRAPAGAARDRLGRAADLRPAEGLAGGRRGRTRRGHRRAGRLDPGGLAGQRAVARRPQGEIPEVGDELGRSQVDGRPWIVRRVEEAGGRTAIQVSKEGPTGDPRLVGHRLTAAPRVP